MKRIGVAFLFAAACSTGTPAQDQSRLSANADAQHVGVYAYAVASDVVTLFDRDGIELGRVAVTAPSAEERDFVAEFTDGQSDQAEIVRPLASGRFIAPVTPETMLTATMADPALAPTWAAHQVRFTLNLSPRLAGGELDPSILANTTACTSYSCSGTGCTPIGCAKPANTSLGCTNPSQLPATTNMSQLAWQANASYPNGDCAANVMADCQTQYGGTIGVPSNSDWNTQTTKCALVSGLQWGYCRTGISTNTWVASCPRSSCGTVGDYDAVPRVGTCVNPGSCDYSQGAITCTPYH